MSAVPLIGARRLRELLDTHGVRPKKSLGQNFVVDPNTIRKVVQIAELSTDERVLEIGAGAGSLTLALADAAAAVIAVEVDSGLLPILIDTVEAVPNVEVRNEDALALDLSTVDADVLVANLPYNIAATLVLDVLERAPRISRLIVMTQQEVGERLAARPGSKVYGQTSVLAAYFADERVASTVSRRAFFPQPNVDSVIVRLDRKQPPPAATGVPLADVVKAAFAQRRKMLRNSLVPLAGSPGAVETALDDARIKRTARAEEVDLDGFLRLAAALGSR